MLQHSFLQVHLITNPKFFFRFYLEFPIKPDSPHRFILVDLIRVIHLLCDKVTGSL